MDEKLQIDHKADHALRARMLGGKKHVGENELSLNERDKMDEKILKLRYEMSIYGSCRWYRISRCKKINAIVLTCVNTTNRCTNDE